MASDRTIAYFSMEIGLEVGMPTYSGGLGVLAGDTIRSAADLKIPLVAMTLLHRKGYFDQRLDASGWQHEEPVAWVVEDFVHELPGRTSVTIEGRTVHLRAWQYTVRGMSGATVPVYFLDADVPENTAWDRTLTDRLYGGDASIGCVRRCCSASVACACSHPGLHQHCRFHMNEGHAGLLTLELLDEQAHRAGRATFTHEDVAVVRQQCVFTTHTPVPAGHDQFPLDLVARVLGDREAFHTMPEVFCCEGVLNMTYLALNLSHYVNGVAKKHGEVSQHMFAGYVIDAITNGVHAGTWTAPPFQALFDHYIPGWREDNFSLRAALSIPPDEVWQAHMVAKRQLIESVNHDTNASLDVDVLTLGFARRATAYKRADLLFQDIERLKRIATQVGAFQVIYAGKAHPRDHAGKELIHRIYQAKDALKDHVKIAYLANYDMALGSLLMAGVHLWLNTPQPPLEASGTSGMKAALNGVPSFSVLDGWWIEGARRRRDGVGHRSAQSKHCRPVDERALDAAALYDKLAQVIVPLFYSNRAGFINVMCHAIAINGQFFNTQRMMHQYVMKAYFL